MLEIHQWTLLRARKILGYDYSTVQYCQHVSLKNQKEWYSFAVKQIERVRDGYRFDDVVFTDETKVILGKHKPKCCHRKGQQPKFRQTFKHPKSYMVWAGISARGSTDLLVFDGIMDATFYVEEILKKTLVPSCKRLFGEDNWRFWQDNGKSYCKIKNNQTEEFWQF